MGCGKVQMEREREEKDRVRKLGGKTGGREHTWGVVLESESDVTICSDCNRGLRGGGGEDDDMYISIYIKYILTGIRLDLFSSGKSQSKSVNLYWSIDKYLAIQLHLIQNISVHPPPLSPNL